jgi:hypothetical protein
MWAKAVHKRASDVARLDDAFNNNIWKGAL